MIIDTLFIILFAVLVITEIVFGILNKINKHETDLIETNMTILTKRVGEWE